MPTLEELFRNKKYERLGDKTPQEAFDVRNSKDIQISTISPLLNSTSVPLINKARLGSNAQRFTETRVESELIGLLPFTNYSEPVLYGTDILRITSQNTSLGEAMKAGTGGRGLISTAAKVVGDTVGEAVQFGGSKLLKVPATFNAKTAITKAGASIKNTLGSFFPDILIPSKVVLSPMFVAKVPGFNEEYRTHEVLARLKDISAGTKVASFLAKNATGTPDQIKQAVIGQGLNIAQQEAKKAVSRQLVKILSKGGDKAQELAKDIQQSTDLSKKYSSLKKYSEITYGEKQYGRPPLNFKNEPTIPPQGPDLDPTDSGRMGIGLLYELEYTGSLEGAKQTKKRFLKEKNQEISNYNNENPIYSKVVRISNRETFGIKDGGKGSTKDTKNSQLPYKVVNGVETAEQLKDSENDYVPLKFLSIGTSTMIVFRGTITGLSEQFSPSWDNTRFIGSPFNFYTYQSIERTVQFSFKVFSLTKDEHRICWQKLAHLSSLCYPQNYTDAGNAVTAPFLKFTMGDMFRDKECFIENMSYNIDDNYPWEIGLSDKSLQNYRLPTIVEVTMTLKFVEAKSNTYNTVFDKDGIQDKTKIGRKMYGFFDDASAISKQNNTPDEKRLQSTNTPYKAPDTNKPDSEKNQVESGEPYPDDVSDAAKEVQKRMKLVKANIFHTPLGQSKARVVYRQKKTDKLYFGDGTPYTAL